MVAPDQFTATLNRCAGNEVAKRKHAATDPPPATAPGPRFEHGHIVAGAVEFMRGAQSGKACANDHDAAAPRPAGEARRHTTGKQSGGSGRGGDEEIAATDTARMTLAEAPNQAGVK